MSTPSATKARRLRASTTDAEHRLWDILRDRRLAGAKFRRQHPIGRYVLDFYCAAARLAIEVDDKHHREPEAIEYDTERAKMLAARAIRVPRFANEEIRHEPERVANAIVSHLRD